MSTKVDQAIARYIKLRDERDEVKKAQAEFIRTEFTEPMLKIENAMLKFLEKTGQNSAKARDIGVAFVSERSSDKVTDRDAWLKFVIENEQFEFIESRVNKAALDEFIEENQDLPPGVSRSVERTVKIRRS